MKKIILLFMYLFLLFLIPESSAITNITNCTDLQAMGVVGNYEVINNIDCSDTINWNAGAGFLPIARTGPRFIGTFDGQGFNITGLYMNYSGGSVGLFGNTDGNTTLNSSLQNINLLDIEYYCDTTSRCGGFVGQAECTEYTFVDNLFANGSISVINANGENGGLIGYLCGEIDIVLLNNSHSDVGMSCLLSSGDCGGLVGYSDAVIANSYSTGDITGDANYVGGIVGYNSGGVINSFSTGDITGGDNVGGISGTNDNWGVLPILINNSYSIGSIIGNDLVGGISGSGDLDIMNSYSTSQINGTTNYGALVGTTSGSCTSSYYNEDLSGINDSNCGSELTLEEFTTESSFVGWDFVNIWNIVSGESSPYSIFSPTSLINTLITPSVPTSGGGGSTYSEINLNSLVIDYPAPWYRETINEIVVETLDLEGNNIDVESISIELLTNVSHNASSPRRESVGVYSREYIINDRFIQNITFEITAIDGFKEITETITIEVESKTFVSEALTKTKDFVIDNLIIILAVILMFGIVFFVIKVFT